MIYHKRESDETLHVPSRVRTICSTTKIKNFHFVFLCKYSEMRFNFMTLDCRLVLSNRDVIYFTLSTRLVLLNDGDFTSRFRFCLNRHWLVRSSQSNFPSNANRFQNARGVLKNVDKQSCNLRECFGAPWPSKHISENCRKEREKECLTFLNV